MWQSRGLPLLDWFTEKETMDDKRILAVGGCSNFRDLGGYQTADKKWRTRWHRLYRSDHLAKVELTEQNTRLLCETLRVRYSVDFRSQKEKKAEPYRIPGVQTTEVEVEPGDLMEILMSSKEIREPAAVEAMLTLNEWLVTRFQPQYRQFLTLVTEKGAEAADTAVVFHCTAGKDRTGFAAALVLLLLGVDRDTVMEDYLLTNKYFRPPPLDELMHSAPGGPKVEEGALQALFYVRREYLERALNTIDSRYGGILNYAKAELGCTDEAIQKLRDAYLEPA